MDARISRMVEAFKAPWAPIPDKLAALRAESLRNRANHWDTPNIPLSEMAGRDITHGAHVVARGGRIVLAALTESLHQVEQEWHGQATGTSPNDPRWTAGYWDKPAKSPLDPSGP